MCLTAILKHFDTANLRLRVMSAVLLAPIALLIVYIGGLPYAALATCAMTIGLYEWLRLVAPDARAQTVGVAGAMLIVIMTVSALFSLPLGASLGALACAAFYLLAKKQGNAQAGWMMFGLPYMAGSGMAFLALRSAPGVGAALVFYVLFVVWATDCGAFFAGRLIGGPKLSPLISPSKTWAGLIGGMAVALVLGYLAAKMLGAREPAVALVVSPLLAGIAQLGDLFESYFKRRADVKESGDLIPGHGGILDRIDGLVFAGVAFTLFQEALGAGIGWW